MNQKRRKKQPNYFVYLLRKTTMKYYNTINDISAKCSGI